MKKEKDFECQHIKKKQDKSIYVYKLINRNIYLCEKCEAKLRSQVFNQDKTEKECADAFAQAFGRESMNKCGN